MFDNTIHVFAPATIANLGGGFDVLGVALENIGDYVTATKIAAGEFTFSVETQVENFSIPTDENIAAFVAQQMLVDLKPDFGIGMVLHKRMPIGSGLGSSGASCVAAAVAVNVLLASPLTKNDLLPYVIAGEEKACGAAHGDNVAPSLFGGGCIVRAHKSFDIIPIHIHKNLTWIILSPQVTLATAASRSVLAEQIPLKIATQQMANIAGLVLGLERGDANLIQHCMEDYIAEPSRISLIPGFNEIKAAALEAGAIACHISGSGPAVFAVTLSPECAQTIGVSMQKALFRATGITANTYISKTNYEGANMIRKVPNAI